MEVVKSFWWRLRVWWFGGVFFGVGGGGGGVFLDGLLDGGVVVWLVVGVVVLYVE